MDLPQVTYEEAKSLLHRHPQPRLTFGLELELDFAISRPLYKAWLATDPIIIPTPPSPGGTPNIDKLRRRDQEARAARWAAIDTVKTNGGKTPDGSDEHPQATAIHLEHGDVLVSDDSREQSDQGQFAHYHNPTAPDDPSPTYSNRSKGSDQSGYQTSSTRDSQCSWTLRSRLLMYFLMFLNRRLPGSKPGPSLMGQVIWEDLPQTEDSSAWHLTYDDSLSPSRNDLAKELEMTFDGVRPLYRCVGAELVSQVLELDREEHWVPMIEELHDDLTLDESHGVWFLDEEHLHVHFAVVGEEITLELAQTLCVLYGLFENQIEKWLDVDQRDNQWCSRLRKGMERPRLRLSDDEMDILTLPEKRYTPGEFADLIYATTSLESLRSQTTGRSGHEELMPDGLPVPELAGGGGARKFTTVNVSMARYNKPTTLEFRHHHGTTDPEVIKWWVRFCGAMVRFAHTLVKCGIKLQEGPPAVGKIGFLSVVTRDDILDVLGFPEAGKEHFKKQAALYFDEGHDAERKLDEMLIQNRIIRRTLGRQPSRYLDAQIKTEQWYKDARADLGLPELPDESTNQHADINRPNLDTVKSGYAQALITVLENIAEGSKLTADEMIAQVAAGQSVEDMDMTSMWSSLSALKSIQASNLRTARGHWDPLPANNRCTIM